MSLALAVLAPSAAAENFLFTHLAGTQGGAGCVDGPAASARFGYAIHAVSDSHGNIFVADYQNAVVRRISPAGVVSTFAGVLGLHGQVDGIGSAARLYQPSRLCVDQGDNLYVVCSTAIRKITPRAEVTTLAVLPVGALSIAVAPTGDVFVSAGTESAIWKITPAGEASRFAGTGAVGAVDGAGSVAQFKYPDGIAVDAHGHVYVADSENFAIRKVTPTGTVSTFAGALGVQAIDPNAADGAGGAARFFRPIQLAFDTAGDLYVQDIGVGLRKITPAGVVTTVVDMQDLRLMSGRIGPCTSGGLLLAAAQEVGRVSVAGQVDRVAGVPAVSGADDGLPADARFSSPYGVAVDFAGIAYVIDRGSCIVRRIDPDGIVTTFAGRAGEYGTTDGPADVARLGNLCGITVGPDGTVYVADGVAVRKISQAGEVTTIAGAPNEWGNTDGPAASARFGLLDGGIAVDASGNVYVGDLYNNYAVRKITATGQVSTIANITGMTGIAIGPGNDIFITVGWWFQMVQRMWPDGTLVPVAGRPGETGTLDGDLATANFESLRAVTVAMDGTVYVLDGNTVRKIASGTVTTIGGIRPPGSSDGIGAAAGFNGPSGIAVDWFGNIYIADTDNHAVRKGELTGPTGPAGVSVLVQPVSLSVGDGAAAAFRTQALGVSPLTYQWQVSTDGANWSDVSDGIGFTGGQTSTLTVVTATQSLSNHLFRCRISNPEAQVYTNAGVLTASERTITSGYLSVAAIAGVPPGAQDGTGNTARFWNPCAIAVDVNGDAYVADTSNCIIRKLATNGAVTTIAGRARERGYVDGAVADARFGSLDGIAVDGSGNVYVIDAGALRRISTTGTVSTVTANSQLCRAIVAAADGTVYGIGLSGLAIVRVSPEGVVTVLAGGTVGENDGTGAAAQFSYPSGITLGADGNLYVADMGGTGSLRKVTPVGEVTTLARWLGYPCGVAVDSAGNVYLGELGMPRIRRVAANGTVTAIAGGTQAGYADANGASARFGEPRALAMTNTGDVYVADARNHCIRRVTAAGAVTTVAGAPSAGSADTGFGVPRFSGPAGITLDGDGNLFVADSTNNSIRRINPAGDVTTIAGSASNPVGFANGTRTAARFWAPRSVAADAAGNVFVADRGNNVIRKITPAGAVTTFAGQPFDPDLDGAPVGGSTDGPGAAAQFFGPMGVAIDAAGNLYVADEQNNTIRKIAPDATVSTLAGTAGAVGSTDGTGAAARFNLPSDVAVDRFGTVFVADAGNHTIRRIAADGTVTTLAGAVGVAGSEDGNGTAARFRRPYGLAVDASGLVYVADAGNNTVRLITPDGEVRTIAGYPAPSGESVCYDPGAGARARLGWVADVTVDAGGAVYICDLLNNVICKGVPVPGPCIQWNTPAPITYGTALSSAQLNATANGTGTMTYSLPVGHHLGAGEYSLTALFVPSDVPLLTATRTVHLTVSPAQLDCTAEDQIWYQGDAMPVFTFRYQGFVWGDGSSVLEEAPTATTTATTDSPAGTYPISVTGGRAANYQLVRHPGTLTIMPPRTAPVFGVGPASLTVAPGGRATFTVSATALPAPSWRWQLSTNGGESWSDLSDTGVYSGTGTAELVVGTAAIELDGAMFRCVATNSKGVANSTPATLTVSARPFFVAQPANRTAAIHAPTTFVVTADGAQPLTYQWQYSAAGSQDWSEVPEAATVGGARSTTLRLSPVGSAMTGNRYRCIVTNPAGSATSNGATLTVVRAVGVSVDLDGDGIMEPVWRSSTTLELGGWTMGGYVRVGQDGAGYEMMGFGDFDGDGRSEAVWRHTGTRALVTWPSGGGYLPLGTESGAWQVLGLGDFDGDGTTEFLWRHAVTAEIATWTMAGAFVHLGNESTGWQVIGVGDFDGDGKTEPLWRHASTTEVGTWTMAGSYARLGAESGGWDVIGVGDFDADGKTEGLWRDRATREVGTWTMAGAYVPLRNENSGWTVIGTGDFDGDGKTEPLWRQTSTQEVGTWTIAGAYVRLGTEANGWRAVPQAPTITGEPAVSQWLRAGASATLTIAVSANPTPILQWQVSSDGSTWADVVDGAEYSGAGTATLTISRAIRAMNGSRYRCIVRNGAGRASSATATLNVSAVACVASDLDGDGRTDLLWRYAPLQELGIWTASGFVHLGTEGTGWVVIGVGDFDADGKMELIWRHSGSGQVATWPSGGGYVPLGTESAWQVIRIGDFDGDGRSELLWRHSGTGQVVTWTQAGTYLELGGETDGWRVIGIADFDGDGRQEPAWRNATTFETRTTTMAGATVRLGTEGGGWTVIAFGDVDGDGKAEPFWRHASTLENVTWPMAGGFVRLGGETGGWHVIAVGDYDGDGKSEPLWQHELTHEIATWTMAGAYLPLGAESGSWLLSRN